MKRLSEQGNINNTQNVVNEAIKTLLSDHECVVIPGFGALLKRKVSARILEDEKLILPPSCQVSFNPLLTSDDGLLTHYLVITLSCSYEEASVEIRKWVLSINRLKNTDEKFDIQDLGVFAFTRTGSMSSNVKLHFESKESIGISSGHYGFKKVKAKKVERQGLAKRVKEEIEERKDSPVYFHNFKQTALKVAAAVIVFGLISTAVWKSNEIGNGALELKLWVFSMFSNDSDKNIEDHGNSTEGIQEKNELKNNAENEQESSSLNQEVYIEALEEGSEKEENEDQSHLTRSQSENQDFLEGIEREISDQEGSSGAGQTESHEEENSVLLVDDESATDYIETEVDNTEVAGETVEGELQEGKYVVVAGCFKSYRNAVNYKQQLIQLNYKADIHYDQRSGLNRVVYGVYSSREEAIEALQMIRFDHNVQAWMTNK